MKKLALLLLAAPAFVLAAAPTWTLTGTASSQAVCTTGTCTDAPSAGNGSQLSGIGGITVVLCADSGQTLSGAGTLRAWVYDDIGGLWARLPDKDLSVTASSVRCQSWDGVYIPGPRGRVAWVPDTVTISSGGTTVRINVSGQKGEPL